MGSSRRKGHDATRGFLTAEPGCVDSDAGIPRKAQHSPIIVEPVRGILRPEAEHDEIRRPFVCRMQNHRAGIPDVEAKVPVSPLVWTKRFGSLATNGREETPCIAPIGRFALFESAPIRGRGQRDVRRIDGRHLDGRAGSLSERSSRNDRRVSQL